MAMKIVKFIKYVCLVVFVFAGVVGCEKEIENVGVNLIDNDVFQTDDTIFEVVSASENITKVKATALSQYLLGVYQDNEFGQLKSSIVSQLSLPLSGDNYTFGANVAIDSVIVDIPYQSTKALENTSEGKPIFEIDSVIGNRNVAFEINVYELMTFLNTLDPADPAKQAVYYSDKEYQKGASKLYSGNFKANANDTVAYIKRWNFDHTETYDIDTIKRDLAAPSIKLPLDEDMIKQIFIDDASGDQFASQDNFIHNFRGLFIEAEEASNPASHLLSLDLLNARMTMYYSEDDGDTRVKKQLQFNLTGVKNSIFDRDYSTAYSSGTERLYVQGAAGSDAIIELLGNEDLEEIRENNWLINEANLVFHIDQNASSDIIPEQLFLYNYDENELLIDIFTEGLVVFGGILNKDEEGNPISYTFRITDYISRILKEGSTEELNKLALKVFNPRDLPIAQGDVNIKNFSWNPKGVVLFDHSASNGEKRIKLEIYYTEINN